MNSNNFQFQFFEKLKNEFENFPFSFFLIGFIEHEVIHLSNDHQLFLFSYCFLFIHDALGTHVQFDQASLQDKSYIRTYRN